MISLPLRFVMPDQDQDQDQDQGPGSSPYSECSLKSRKRLDIHHLPNKIVLILLIGVSPILARSVQYLGLWVDPDYLQGLWRLAPYSSTLSKYPIVTNGETIWPFVWFDEGNFHFDHPLLALFPLACLLVLLLHSSRPSLQVRRSQQHWPPRHLLALHAWCGLYCGAVVYLVGCLC